MEFTPGILVIYEQLMFSDSLKLYPVHHIEDMQAVKNIMHCLNFAWTIFIFANYRLVLENMDYKKDNWQIKKKSES